MEQKIIKALEKAGFTKSKISKNGEWYEAGSNKINIKKLLILLRYIELEKENAE